jgi:DNA processing protein
MNHDKLLYDIALTQLFMVGPRTARTLIEHFGSAEAIFKENPEILRQIGNVGAYISDSGYQQEALRRAEKEIEFIVKNKIKVATFDSAEYPYRLKQCSDAPQILYQYGDCDLNAKKFVAIIGTRNATKYGKDLTNNLVKTLAQSNPDTVIISGLAYGIDVTAHKAALEYGLPTIGIMAHGLDRIYPNAHREYASKMIKSGGAIVTEYLSKTTPDPQNFVQRNRIVAGMCDVAVVVESAIKGGSLITANIANDYNRDVMAFPGRVGDKASEGCNKLISQHKAEIITSVEDLINLMGWSASSSNAVQQTLFNELSPEQQTIIDILKIEPQHINIISTHLDLSIQKTSALLTEMVFNELIDQLPGNIYSIKLKFES